MFKYLLFALIVVPFVELYLLVTIGREIGFAPTLGLVLLTGVVGTWLARREGSRVMSRWQSSLAMRQVPEEGLFSGALIMLGGVLLVIPGVLTDVAGLLLLLPPVRRWVTARLRRSVERRMREGSLHVTTIGGMGFPGPFGGAPPPGGPSFPRSWDEDSQGPSARMRPGAPRSEVDAEFTEEEPRH
ncbi:FxsA family protein [Myxococcus stipitatus]|uniref:FxsA family protein n=1 Tax=Myxococcus stipitatus TaxID=83455 RepID=UPI0030D1E51D